jgi:hypothetical protein
MWYYISSVNRTKRTPTNQYTNTMQSPITEQTDLTEIALNAGGRFLYPGTLVHYYKNAWFHIAERALQNSGEAGTGNNYHISFSHTNHVFHECMVGGTAAVIAGHMTPDDLRDLGITAIGHDLNRSLKAGAIDRDHLASAFEMITRTILPEDRHRLPRIEKILWATLFELPRVRLQDPTMPEQIIADVDMTQVFTRFYMDLTYVGLAKEMKKTPLQMVETQEGFIRSIRFYTAWAEARFGPMVEPKIAHVHRLLEILKG